MSDPIRYTRRMQKELSDKERRAAETDWHYEQSQRKIMMAMSRSDKMTLTVHRAGCAQHSQLGGWAEGRCTCGAKPISNE